MNAIITYEWPKPAVTAAYTCTVVPPPRLLRWLTPEAAINFAYDHHVRQDPHASPEAKQMSTDALMPLEALSREMRVLSPHSPDVQYWSQVQSVIVSHGNGITRRKKKFAEELNYAKEHQEMLGGQLSSSRFWGLLLKFVWKAAGVIAIGVIGALTVKFAAPLLPDAAINAKGHTDNALTGIAGISFFVIAGAISNWWSKRKIDRIRVEYTLLRQSAEEDYQDGKSVEIDAHWAQLCQLWQDYTGDTWKRLPAYVRSIRADAQMTKENTKMLETTTRTDLTQVIEGLKEHLRRKRKKHTHELSLSTVPNT